MPNTTSIFQAQSPVHHIEEHYNLSRAIKEIKLQHQKKLNCQERYLLHRIIGDLKLRSHNQLEDVAQINHMITKRGQKFGSALTGVARESLSSSHGDIDAFGQHKKVVKRMGQNEAYRVVALRLAEMSDEGIARIAVNIAGI